MPHAALWAGGLFACISLVALAGALAGRSADRWKVILIIVAAAAGPLLFSIGAVIAAVWLRGIGSEPSWLGYALGWLGAFAVGAGAILLLASRRRADGSFASASWRRFPLLGGCLIGIAGFFFSLARMDASRRADMEARRRARLETLAAYVRPPVPARENAAPHYSSAFELLDDLGTPSDFAAEVFEPDFEVKTEEAREHMANGAEALQAIRKALSFPHMRDDTGEADWVEEGHAYHFRDASVLVVLEARARASEDNLEAAFSSVTDLWKLAGHALEANRTVIGFLLACDLAEAASRMTESLLGDLGRRDLPRSAEAPPTHLEFHARTSWEIEREAARLQAFLLRVLGETQGPMGPELPGIDRIVVPGPPGSLFIAQYLALYRCFVLPGDLASFDSRISRLITLAGRPWPEAHSGLRELEEEMKRRPGGLFTGMMLPNLAGVLRRATSADTHVVLARTALAAAAFRARRGAYPARIDDLIPEFLPEIPLDPFDGKPLRLTSSGGGLVLHSVGQDEIDDRGEERAETHGRNGDLSFRLGAARTLDRDGGETPAPEGDSTEE